MNSKLEELESLLFDWEAGTLSDEGVERVREILRSDEDAKAFFVQQQVLTAALKLDVDAGLEPPAMESPAVEPSTVEERIPVLNPSVSRKQLNRDSRINLWAAFAGLCLICVLAVRVFYLEASKSSGPESIAGINDLQHGEKGEATSSGIALVTSLVDVIWEADQSPLEVGDALSPGRLAIVSGFAQIEFFCGATVIVEGPAELDLKSVSAARVHHGRLRAQVPPAARGFSLELDDMKLVDLGTEFGVSMSPDGADVQVFDGEVELHKPGQSKRLMTTGQAGVFKEDGTFQVEQIQPEQFLDIATLELRAKSQDESRYQAWKLWSSNFQRDSRLIAYYSFDEEGDWKRKLKSSIQAESGELDGAIVGANRVQGRWSSKSALEFKRPGDRVRMHIPGEFSSLTLSCWVKIDSLDRWYNSLFLTDGYNQGEPHWQILDTGQLFFSVRHKSDDARGPDARKRTHHIVLSPPFWKPSLSGRWLHLATTYDAGSGKTKHYLNGDLLHEEEIAKDLLVKTTRIRDASIGNWTLPTEEDTEFAVRNLNGSIDEFAIFAAALSASEIKEIYNHGKP
ncbi:LamG-like jellyroll fold domain-containing protein [Thalassoglobus polymorphus]|uniref:LamG-like jellyroll fold domain-containing protein n=1 Tax=Thalassoglobus polymorphus TaxID=2527994 RepID=UPI00119E3E67|nr:LamG-like jellyroll fold domain-containing protein [Thalassoglobus polymorphus]